MIKRGFDVGIAYDGAVVETERRARQSDARAARASGRRRTDPGKDTAARPRRHPGDRIRDRLRGGGSRAEPDQVFSDFEGAIEVGDEVVGVLEPDVQPDEVRPRAALTRCVSGRPASARLS